MLAAQPDRRLGLAQEPLHDLLIPEHLREQELHRDRLMKLEVHRLHDDAHPALTEHAVHAVPARKYSTDRNASAIRHRLACIVALEASNGPLMLAPFLQTQYPSPTPFNVRQ
ncbi:MAG TPA: hypothetical protein VK601_06565 [Kofleriaceae bacterium]|nr:hypothetical protein [Kofleriaceae bacterium]